MAYIDRVQVRRDPLNFIYSINCNKNGTFTTTLPDEISDILSKAGIDLARNRQDNPGFFCSETKQGLKKKVSEVIEEYFSKEEIENVIVIRYQIETTCSYCLDDKGDIAPNGETRWTRIENEYNACKWQDGTTGSTASSMNDNPFGFSIFMEVKRKITSRYRSGAVKSEYKKLDRSKIEEGTFLDYINCITHKRSIFNCEVKEIKYTEEAAEFFVGIFKALCFLNEKIKGRLDPENIQKAIDNKIKLLG